MYQLKRNNKLCHIIISPAGDEDDLDDDDMRYQSQMGQTDIAAMRREGIITEWTSISPMTFMCIYNTRRYTSESRFRRAVRDFLESRWERANARMRKLGRNDNRIRRGLARFMIPVRNLNISFIFNGLEDTLNRIPREAIPIGEGDLFEYKKRIIVNARFTRNTKYLLYNPFKTDEQNDRLKVKDLTPQMHRVLINPNYSFETGLDQLLNDLYGQRFKFRSVRFYSLSPYGMTVNGSTERTVILPHQYPLVLFKRKYKAEIMKMLRNEDEDEENESDIFNRAFQFGDNPDEFRLGIAAWPEPDGCARENFDTLYEFNQVAVKLHVVYDSGWVGKCMPRCLMYLANKFNTPADIAKTFFKVRSITKLKSMLDQYFPMVGFLKALYQNFGSNCE